MDAQMIDGPYPHIEPLDHEEKVSETALRRKINWLVLPIYPLLYGVVYLIRTNVNNVFQSGLQGSSANFLTTHRYGITLVIYQIGYGFPELFWNEFLLRFDSRTWLAVVLGFTGVFGALTGAADSFGALAGIRFCLGFFEGAFFPGALYLLSRWYRREHLLFPVTVFFSGAAMLSVFGNLLASPIVKLDGTYNRPGWAWVAIIEGLVALAIAAVCLWFLPVFPELDRTHRNFSAAERITFAELISWSEPVRSVPENLRPGHWKRALSDKKTYFFIVVNMTAIIPRDGFVLALAGVVRKLNLTSSPEYIILLTVPPLVTACLFTLLVGYYARGSTQSGIVNMTCSSMAMVGAIILTSEPNPSASYFAMFIGLMGSFAAGANTLAWLCNNFEGYTKRAVVIGLCIGVTNTIDVVIPATYLLVKPRVCFAVILGLSATNILASFLLRLYLKHRNARNEDILASGQYTLRSPDSNSVDQVGDISPEYVHFY